MNLWASLEATGLATWLRESPSVWALPTILTLHTIGLAVLVGSAWAVDLRLLGVAPAIPLEPFSLLFRAMWIGFWINALTGVMLFMSDATRKGASTTFLIKMSFVAAGVVTMLLIQRRLRDRGAGGDFTTGTVRRLAVSSLVVWALAIAAGRLLAYIP